MHVVKIRRVGNRNVVTLPRQLEAAGYTPGSSVVIEVSPSGELVLHREERVRENVAALGQRLIAERREALDLLAAMDRGEAVAEDGLIRRSPPGNAPDH
jgi:antitoxin component of MazEF toxin-antitoxin module